MPVSKHLRWAEISDFSAGWSNRNDWLMPATAAQTMQDCYPVDGGLRAFWQPYYLTSSGLTSTDRCIAVHTVTQSTGPAYLVAMYRPSDRKTRVYGLSLHFGETTWNLVFTSGAGAVDANPRGNFCSYVSTLGGSCIIWAGFADIASIQRIRNTALNTWSTTTISTAYGPPVVNYQSRLMAAGIAKVAWTDPAGEAFNTGGAGGEISIYTNDNDTQNAVVVLSPNQPSDLWVGTAADGWFVIEGDLGDPIMRAMSDAHFAGYPQILGRTPQGIVFEEPYGGIYVTQGGADFQRLDPQLKTIAAGFGHGMGYKQGYLFAPEGRVMDYDQSKGWFNLSEAALINLWQPDQLEGWTGFASTPANAAVGNTCWGIQLQDSFKIVHYPTKDNSAAAAPSGSVWSGNPITAGTLVRYNTYTWKSAPLRDPDGSQVEIREVQVICKPYRTGSTVAVTVNGTTRTSASLTSGRREVVNFLFRERDEVLDVQVVPSSGSSTVEAPSIEAVRIGTGLGHRLY